MDNVHKRVLISIILIAALATLTYALTTNSMEEKTKEMVPQYYYTVKEMDKVSAYIEQQYGESDLVGHEVVSPDIHCDIVIVPPTEEQPYYKLVTMGAGAYKMNIPKELKGDVCDRAEYVIFLPKDWDLESTDEEFYWPIRMMKKIARLTVNTDDWLGFRHTVNLTGDGSPVAENTKFNSCVLLPSLGKEGQYVEPLKLSLFGKKVAFFQIYPLYQEELEFKLDHSFDELIDKIEADGEITDRKLIIDIHRKNYCK